MDNIPFKVEEAIKNLESEFFKKSCFDHVIHDAILVLHDDGACVVTSPHCLATSLFQEMEDPEEIQELYDILSSLSRERLIELLSATQPLVNKLGSGSLKIDLFFFLSSYQEKDIITLIKKASQLIERGCSPSKIVSILKCLGSLNFKDRVGLICFWSEHHKNEEFSLFFDEMIEKIATYYPQKILLADYLNKKTPSFISKSSSSPCNTCSDNSSKNYTVYQDLIKKSQEELILTFPFGTLGNFSVSPDSFKRNYNQLGSPLFNMVQKNLETSLLQIIHASTFYQNLKYHPQDYLYVKNKLYPHLGIHHTITFDLDAIYISQDLETLSVQEMINKIFEKESLLNLMSLSLKNFQRDLETASQNIINELDSILNSYTTTFRKEKYRLTIKEFSYLLTHFGYINQGDSSYEI